MLKELMDYVKKYSEKFVHRPPVPEEKRKFFPCVLVKKQPAYRRAREYSSSESPIVFMCQGLDKGLIEFKITAENGNAFADLSYLAQGKVLKTRIDDGYANLDNGSVEACEEFNALTIRWNLGSHIKLGRWKVEMTAVGGNTTEYVVDEIQVWGCEKNTTAAGSSYWTTLNRVETAR